ncbi:MAG: aldo/keto reductase [Candidatus Aminicenantes bacterium]|nr:aldo/keto reductase [Candidatus Aminicenantes bacterium]
MALRDLIEHSSKRRSILKALLAGAALPFRAVLPSRAQKTEPSRIIKDGMAYRRLGRTGLLVSEIALGGSPLPDWDLLLRLIERGVNYIDTSHTYDNGNSERTIGRLFKAVGRDTIHVCTKFHVEGNWSEKSIIASVEGSLRRLGTDAIDVLAIHGADRAEDLTDERLLAAFDNLKAQGKFRFRGLSCHSNHQAVVAKAVDCGLYDMVQLGTNVFDIQETEKNVRTYGDYAGESGLRGLIDRAHGRGVGVIAMKVLKVGGRRQDLAAFQAGGVSLIQAMLKWALDNEKLTAVVTEILSYEQMEEDLGVIGRPMTAAERAVLFAHVAAAKKDYCHMCGLCRAACPAGIKTTEILRALAYADSYGKGQRAVREYSEIRPEKSASACLNCGSCEKACPYGISVRSKLRRAEALLG